VDLKILQAISDRLYHAKKDGKPIEPITTEYPAITFSDAYKIQSLNLDREIKLGFKVVGRKIGLTGKAMQSMFGVYEPDYGAILDNMVFNDGDTLKVNQFILPKVEAEVAFVFKNDLAGPGITPVKVLQATDFKT
jgi:2-keto-4-pentenoate hydratase